MSITQRGAPQVSKNRIKYEFLYNDPAAIIARVEFQCAGPGGGRAYTTPPSTSISFNNLEPNTTYITTATPITIDNTYLSSVVFTPVTTATNPEPPTNVTFRPLNNTQLEVTWIPAASIAAADNAPKWYVLKSTDGIIALTIENWRTSYVTPPLPGGAYKFNLYAVNDAGYSEPVTSQQAYNFI